jgi:hypothetical protein
MRRKPSIAWRPGAGNELAGNSMGSESEGRRNTFASSHGARIQTSRSSSVVRITGIAFGWIGSTIAFGEVLRKP